MGSFKIIAIVVILALAAYPFVSGILKKIPASILKFAAFAIIVVALLYWGFNYLVNAEKPGKFN